MIFPLIRKEFRYDTPVRSLLLGGAFLLSLSDLVLPISRGLVLYLACAAWLLIVVIGSGASSLFEDRNKHSRFVEYLPVRRSELWLADVLYQLAFLVLFLLCLFWSWLVSFTPGDHFPLVFHSRWELLLGLAAVGLWIYAMGNFFLCLCDMKTSSRVLAVLFPLLVLLVHGLILADYFRLFPSLGELAPVFLFSSLLFFSAGCFLFVLRGRHVPVWKRSVFFALPLFLFIMAATEVSLYGPCLRWKELSLAEKVEIKGVRLVRSRNGDQPILLASVRSPRSDGHWISIDLDTKRFHHLGRLIYLLSLETFFDGTSEKLLFRSGRSPNSLFVDDEYLLTMDTDGDNRRRVVMMSDYRSWVGELYSLSFFSPEFGYEGFIWNLVNCFPAQGSLAFAEQRYLPDEDRFEENLVITDTEGRIRKRVSCLLLSTPSVSGGNHVLGLAPTEQPNRYHYEVAKEDPYVLVDVDDLSVKRFDLPGEVLTVSADVTQALCAVTRVEGNEERYSILLVEIPSLEQQVLIAEDELPAVELLEPVTRTPEPFLRSDTWISSSSMKIPFRLYVDREFTFAVWVDRYVDDSYFNHTIYLIDLSTGEKRLIVPSTELPRVPVLSASTDGLEISGEDLTDWETTGKVSARWDRSGKTVTVYGPAPLGDGVIYGFGDSILRKSAGADEAVLVADLGLGIQPAKTDRARISASGPYFSPDMRRICRTVREFHEDQGREYGKSDARVEVIEGRKRTIAFESDDGWSLDVLWLDDKRLLIASQYEILLVNADGTGLEQIFPPQREVSGQ